MAIAIKTERQIEKMRQASAIVAHTHKLLEAAIRPGITTKELDKMAETYIKKQNAVPSFKGYRGFPASICTSVNNEVIHGIPGGRKLKEGDIISIDIGAIFEGYHGDAARTHAVGHISAEAKKLIDVTKQSFFEGIQFAKKDCHLHQIGARIQQYVEANGLSIVREYVGHGIGAQMHEAPEIPNYKPKGRGPKLAPGMTLAIEPMVNMGGKDIDVLQDGWTVVTKDGQYSAHYENTVLVTDGEPLLLTI